MTEVVLGVSGSIAAYKAADIAHRLTQQGCNVNVILTEAATRFITPLTFQTLTRRPVWTDQFSLADPGSVRHIELARQGDIAILAPATADLIGRLAHGLADDMLSTVMLAWTGRPKLLAPAMNQAMYAQPVVQDNLARLVGYGWQLIEPRVAELACGDIGQGALATVDDIVAAVLDHRITDGGH